MLWSFEPDHRVHLCTNSRLILHVMQDGAFLNAVIEPTFHLLSLRFVFLVPGLEYLLLHL